MSYYDYQRADALVKLDEPFYALIMAAMRRADTNNARLLRVGWPEVWQEVQARYDSPGGILPHERAVEN